VELGTFALFLQFCEHCMFVRFFDILILFTVLSLDNILLLHYDFLIWLLLLKMWKMKAMLNRHKMRATAKRMRIGGYIFLKSTDFFTSILLHYC